MSADHVNVLPAPEPAKALLRDAALARVLALIDCDGEEARLIGGALRNALIGRPVFDCDIATTATPEAVMARAQKAGIRAIGTGIEHGTVTLVLDGKPFEVTSLREDVETDGRHAKVRFSRDFAADALRRDFTMNALSMTRDGTLYDYTGGLADLEARRLRFIGDPVARIKEDYLRILRFFRFAADYGEGPLDEAALHAAMIERDGLARLSRERIRSEIMKLLAARRADEVVRIFCQTGLFGPLVASAPNTLRLEAMLRYRADEPVDALLRLAALCLNLPEDALRLRDYLRLSNQEYQRLEAAGKALVALHGMAAPPVGAGLLRLLFRYGRQTACDALILLQADAGPNAIAAFDAAIGFLRAAQEPKLPFSGSDLLARGMAGGPAIGETLRVLQERWVEAGFPQDPHLLAKLLEETVAQTGTDENEASE
jgi:poly(A) polymerase